ncbi:MAG TPA: hypothetical protein DHV26_05970 [Cytophagales bacterium]|nr:hypothetical protein [Cytophagales bacterium]HRG09045.1 hypothetical protein [Cyclobacteriaceae bacterium]
MSNSINWPEVHKHILALQQRDAKSYTKAGYVMIALSIVMLFIFPFGSLIVLAIAVYLFYDAYTNKKKLFSYVIQGVIQKKECYYYPPREPEASEPRTPEPSVFLFYADKISCFQTSATALVPVTLRWANTIKTNSLIYNHFKAGDSFTFIMSPVKDLIGYVYQNQVVLLTANAGGREISLTIPQTIDLRDAILFQD